MKMESFLIAVSILIVLCSGCCEINNEDKTHPDIDRESKNPQDIEKRIPSGDRHPPILHSDLFEDPISVDYPINTAGAEDSPFILPDGNTLYFFFTPDVRVPAEKQVIDDVTGLYVSHRNGSGWSRPERVWLQDPGKLSMDGAVCIQDEEMWFASVREGYTGPNMFTARWDGSHWTDWEYVGDHLMKDLKIGEVHIHGDDLYFHSDRAGGKGNYDIWMTTRTGDTWSEPIPIDAVNSPEMDGFPFITNDGNEMWFTRTYMGTPAVYRSMKYNGTWGDPHIVFSQFAGEPTLDDDGNLYFVHHFYEDGTMIEADIYFAQRK